MDSKEFTNKSDIGKSNIAWMAGVHIALKTFQDEANNKSKELLIHPDRITINNYSPKEAYELKNELMLHFETFCQSAIESDFDDGKLFKPSSYLNRSAIVYADAIMQGYLDNALELLKIDCNSSIVYGKLKAIKSKIDFTCVNHFRPVIFMSNLRNIITHKNGKVDCKFWENIGVEKSAKDEQYWDHKIWKSKEDIKKDYPIDRYGLFSIEKVVIPHLYHCIKFIDEYSKKVLEMNK